MTGRKRGHRPPAAGSPKSPRVLEAASTSASAAPDRRAPAAGEGPRNNRAPSSNRAQPQHQPQPPSVTTPTTPQRQVRSIASAASAAPHRASPPHHLRLGVVHQSAARGPAAWSPASAAHPPLPSLGVQAPQTPRVQAAAATTSRARAHSPSPPPGSRSSSASSSGLSHMSVDSSASVSSTYASIVRGANQKSCVNLSLRLLHFLKAEMSVNKEMTARDMNPIISLMSVAGRFSLSFDFQRLLKYDKELAYATCNSQDRFNEWVYPTVSQFLTSNGITKNVAETMKVTFSGMPHSIKSLEYFIREQPLASNKSIFRGHGIFQLCVATDVGMMLVHGFLVEVFNGHLQDLTWNGGFSLSDMAVVNSTQCMITKEPMKDESHCIAEDLRKIGDIFMPMFNCHGEMPLYFDVLKQDLQGANKNLVKQEWFWEYLLAHPALKQPLARCNLECGLKQAAEIFGGPGTPLQSVLGAHSDWKALIPAKLTENTPATDVILYNAFWFNREPTEGFKDPFGATVGELLRYKRNFLKHGQDYADVEVLSDFEQFEAKTFPQALPTFLRSLLRDCKIHTDGPLNELWREYHPPHHPRVGR